MSGITIAGALSHQPAWKRNQMQVLAWEKLIKSWDKDDKTFLDTLRMKVVMLVADHGPIVDTVHDAGSYHDVESIINFLISHYLEKWEKNVGK